MIAVMKQTVAYLVFNFGYCLLSRWFNGMCMLLCVRCCQTVLSTCTCCVYFFSSSSMHTVSTHTYTHTLSLSLCFESMLLVQDHQLFTCPSSLTFYISLFFFFCLLQLSLVYLFYPLFLSFSLPPSLSLGCHLILSSFCSVSAFLFVVFIILLLPSLPSFLFFPLVFVTLFFLSLFLFHCCSTLFPSFSFSSSFSLSLVSFFFTFFFSMLSNTGDDLLN